MTNSWTVKSCIAAAVLLSAIESSGAADATQSATSKVRVIDELTALPVADAAVIVDGKSYPTDGSGTATIPMDGSSKAALTVTAAYLDGKIRRLETTHGLKAAPEVVLRVPNVHGVRREAVFSVGVPFGPIQRQAKAMLLLPQPAYESGGLNFGHYNQVRLYQDQLQEDGRFSLMVVALDENLVPWKFGYMLDVDAARFDEAHLMFMPPMATGIDFERQLVRWRKLADPLSPSDEASACDFKAPPFTECGLYPDKGGIFSWINVWRKGQLFHTPGAFLPARTTGANPLMALPDAQIELVGHDDPKGFAPFNYARHRFLRFDTPPTNVVDITMPDVIIGSAEQTGPDAISVDATARGARFVIASTGTAKVDANDLDLGKFQMIWSSGSNNVRTIWNHYFAPRSGENTVTLSAVPESLAGWLPADAQQKFENVQVWLYASDGVNGYDQALALRAEGKDPVREGATAFQVTRWR